MEFCLGDEKAIRGTAVTVPRILILDQGISVEATTL
jgi:hypothetical protein